MTGPEIVEFSKAINGAYTYDELSDLLDSINRTITDYAIAQSTYPAQVKQIVGAAHSQGWISQLVLAVLSDPQQNNQSIKDFVSLHPYWDPANHPRLAHPADTLRIFGGRSFIGRDTFRDAVKKMNQRTGRRALVITSTHRKVGKTYSKDLIDFVSQTLQPSEVAYIDLDSENYTPITLAKKLAGELKMSPNDIPDEATEQHPRSSADLISILIRKETNAAPTVWWIVLDGFREKIPSEPVKEFISQLAKRIQNTEEYRLILINYTSSLPPEVNLFSYKDDLKPISRTEIETHFTNVHRQKFKSNPLPAQLAEYLSGMDDLYQQFKQDYPESVDDQVLVNSAVTIVTDTIEEDVP
jgi:hypothetical protein